MGAKGLPRRATVAVIPRNVVHRAIQIARVDELRPPGSAGSWLAPLADPIKRSIACIRSTHRTRRAVRELMALDDRLLADIGVSRVEAAYAVRHGRERWR